MLPFSLIQMGSCSIDAGEGSSKKRKSKVKWAAKEVDGLLGFMADRYLATSYKGLKDWLQRS